MICSFLSQTAAGRMSSAVLAEVSAEGKAVLGLLAKVKFAEGPPFPLSSPSPSNLKCKDVSSLAGCCVQQPSWRDCWPEGPVVCCAFSQLPDCPGGA